MRVNFKKVVTVLTLISFMTFYFVPITLAEEKEHKQVRNMINSLFNGFIIDGKDLTARHYQIRGLSVVRDYIYDIPQLKDDDYHDESEDDKSDDEDEKINDYYKNLTTPALYELASQKIKENYLGGNRLKSTEILEINRELIYRLDKVTKSSGITVQNYMYGMVNLGFTGKVLAETTVQDAALIAKYLPESKDKEKQKKSTNKSESKFDTKKILKEIEKANDEIIKGNKKFEEGKVPQAYHKYEKAITKGLDVLRIAKIEYRGDNDFDGVENYIEFAFGTNPFMVDTDGDGLGDKFEIAFYEVLDPTKKDTDGNEVLDGVEDFDQDGLENRKEQEVFTNPTLEDTDRDLLSDGKEVGKYRTNPVKADTDTDGLDDGTEIELGTDPNNSDTNGNGILDGQENYVQTIVDSELGASVKFDAQGDADKIK